LDRTDRQQADRTDWPQTEDEIWHATPDASGCPHCGEASRGAGGFDWSFLDAAYCISLRGRPDRAAAAAAEFHRVGLCGRVTFFRPEKDPDSVRLGIWQSHRRVAEHALRHGRSTVLICEDDVMFSHRIGPAAVRAVAAALPALPRDWMVLYLGHWPLWGYFVRRNLLRCGSACCHAYIASERMLRWLRDNPPDSVPIARIAGRGVDAAFARLPATYAMFPMLAIQRPGRSDNMGVAGGRRKKKLKHLITRSRRRELLLSSLMRPNEMLIAALSPGFFLWHRIAKRRVARP
jgi:glycosyl transferase, family 25